MDTSSKTFLTTKEAARFLGIAYQTLEKGRCGYGRINPPYIRIGRSIRYEFQALVEFMNGHRAQLHG